MTVREIRRLMAEKLPTILDNRGDNKVLAAFGRLLPMACRWKIATGYFEIGSLLDLDGLWQPLEEIRILLGDEVTRRTRSELVNNICRQSDESVEAAKEKDPSLSGLEAIRRSLSCGHIRAKVYTKAKFHAKGYYGVDFGDTDEISLVPLYRYHHGAVVEYSDEELAGKQRIDDENGTARS